MARLLPLTAGVEIEFTFSGYRTSHAQYGYKAPEFHADFPGWKLSTDASCGYELVSPVLRDEADLDGMDALVQGLVDNETEVDRRCGLHVHIGLAGYSQARIERLLQFLVRYEESFFQLAAPHRRESIYCKAISDEVMAFMESHTALEKWTFSHRRHWINLAAMQEHGTLEFRLMESKLDAGFIRGWVEFLLVLCHKLLNDDKVVNRVKSKVAYKRSTVQSAALLMHNLLVKSEAFYGPVRNADMAKRARSWATERFAALHGYRHKSAINREQRNRSKLPK